MKKLCAIMLALALLSAAAVCAIAIQTNALRDAVRVTERVSSGDPTAAQGLKIQLNATYQERLFWRTAFSPGEPDAAETTFRYFGKAHTNMPAPQTKISVESGLEFSFSSAVPAAERTGLQRAFGELYDATPAGARNTKKIQLKDYYEYYPVKVVLSLPGALTMLTEGPVWEAFQNFFRIPVQDTDTMEICVDRQNESAYYQEHEAYETRGNYYYLYSVGIVSTAGNRCYLAIDPGYQAEYGAPRLADTGGIPGGYGIYSFSFAPDLPVEKCETELLTGAIETVLPLAEDAVVTELSLNADETKLLIYTLEPDGFYLTVFDTGSMKTAQKLRLCDLPYDMLFEDGNVRIVLSENAEKLTVITEEADVFTVQYTVPAATLTARDKSAASLWNAKSLAFADGKLAIAVMENVYDSPNTCDCTLFVFDRTGLIFRGTYENGLGSGQSDFVNYNCYPDYDLPVKIEW